MEVAGAERGDNRVSEGYKSWTSCDDGVDNVVRYAPNVEKEDLT